MARGPAAPDPRVTRLRLLLPLTLLGPTLPAPAALGDQDTAAWEPPASRTRRPAKERADAGSVGHALGKPP